MLIFRDPRKNWIRTQAKYWWKKDSSFQICIDNFLSWQKMEQEMRSRLSRAAGMLGKIRHYVNFETLKMVYYGIFASILNYGSLIWGQHNRIVNRLQIIQNKAVRYMTFKPKRVSTAPLFKEAGILNLSDYITQQNFLFAHDCINRNLSTAFVQATWNTRGERLNRLVNIRSNTIL